MLIFKTTAHTFIQFMYKPVWQRYYQLHHKLSSFCNECPGHNTYPSKKEACAGCGLSLFQSPARLYIPVFLIHIIKRLHCPGNIWYHFFGRIDQYNFPHDPGYRNIVVFQNLFLFLLIHQFAAFIYKKATVMAYPDIVCILNVFPHPIDPRQFSIIRIGCGYRFTCVISRISKIIC